MNTTGHANNNIGAAVTKHWEEIAIAVVIIGATLVLNPTDQSGKAAVFVVDILTAIIALSVALLKNTFLEAASTIAARRGQADSITGHMGHALDMLAGQDREFAFAIAKKASEQIDKVLSGIRPLDETEYFTELLATMRLSDSRCHVLAVNSIDMARWTEDPRQMNYLQANVEALGKGVTIRRVFLVAKGDMASAKGPEIQETILFQRNKGVEVHVVWTHLVQGTDLLDDFVLFRHPRDMLFLDEVDPHDTTRVLRGEVITHPEKIGEYERNFRNLLTYAIPQGDLDRTLAQSLAGH